MQMYMHSSNYFYANSYEFYGSKCMHATYETPIFGQFSAPISCGMTRKLSSMADWNSLIVGTQHSHPGAPESSGATETKSVSLGRKTRFWAHLVEMACFS